MTNSIPLRIPEISDPRLDAIYRKVAETCLEGRTKFYQEKTEEVRNLSFLGNIKKLVEVGCGDGGLAYNIAKRLSNVDIVAEDVDEIAIMAARKRFSAPNLRYQVGDVYSLSNRHRDVDTIVINDSLHHFDKLNIALTQINSSLRHEGGLICWDLDRGRFYNDLCVERPELKQLLEDISVKRKKSKEVTVDFLESLGLIGNAIMSYAAAYRYEEVRTELEKTNFGVLMIGPDERRGYGLFAVKVNPGEKSNRILASLFF